MSILQKLATELAAKNHSTLPLNADKTPAISGWAELKKRVPTPAEITRDFTTKSIGLITGFNDLEAIDVDCKYDLTGTLYSDLERKIAKELPSIIDKVIIQKTVNNGYHIVYRCSEIEGNKKLAERLPTKAELEANPRAKSKALIETRGRFGYIVISPSKGYEMLQGDFESIPEISPQERNKLIEICKSFDQIERKIEPEIKPKNSPKVRQKAVNNSANNSTSFEISTATDYNNRTNMCDLLSGYGWRIMNTDSEGKTFVKRPGASTAKNSGNVKNNCLFCFSTNAGLESETLYTCFDFYAEMEHNNDKSEAAKELFKKGFGRLKNDVERPQKAEQKQNKKEDNRSEILKKLMQAENSLNDAKKGNINFQPPLISQGETALIFPNTINSIQGQTGHHKSRLAQMICSVLLERSGYDATLLGMKKNPKSGKKITVAYLDTEMGMKDQLPYALQRITYLAGYNRFEVLNTLRNSSLKMIQRTHRLDATKYWIESIRKSTDDHLVIVLDVITDCVSDFNNSKESSAMCDYLNMMIENYDCTFICVVHENPNPSGTSKARGHVGTELVNKSTTSIQVRYEKDAKNDDTDILRLKFLKCRSIGRPKPVYASYDPEKETLVLADQAEVTANQVKRFQKAEIEDVIDLLEGFLRDGKKRQIDALSFLQEKFNIGYSTAKKRVDWIIKNKATLLNKDGQDCYLQYSRPKKEVHLGLVVVK